MNQYLNSMLTKEFERSLRAYGFQKAKGRQPYYIRVAPGGEILHVITFYEDKRAVTNGNKMAFDIMGGIAAVYRRELTFSKNVRTNLNWMRSNGWIIANHKRLMPEYEFPQNILGMTMHTYYADPANNFGNNRPNDFYNEGLLYFLVNPHVFRSITPFPSGEFELKCHEVFEKKQGDYNLLERVKEELKRRKSQNIESLLSYL